MDLSLSVRVIRPMANIHIQYRVRSGANSKCWLFPMEYKANALVGGRSALQREELLIASEAVCTSARPGCLEGSE